MSLTCLFGNFLRIVITIYCSLLETLLRLSFQFVDTSSLPTPSYAYYTLSVLVSAKSNALYKISLLLACILSSIDGSCEPLFLDQCLSSFFLAWPKKRLLKIA